MTWTNERVEQLRHLWNEGLTASQIARELGGGVSRNAVIGKAHRLGLGNRASTNKSLESNGCEAPAEPEPAAAAPEADEEPAVDVAAAKEEETTATETEAQVAPETFVADTESNVDIIAKEEEQEEQSAAAIAAEVEKNARKLSLLELNERTCKWPIGDPSTDDFYFCGLKCAPDKPYCEAHAALAYQPMSSRRDRERHRSRTRAISA